MKILLSERAHNRAQVSMTPEDLAIWCGIAQGQGKRWAALVTVSIRQDHADANLMSTMTKAVTILKAALTVVETFTHKETVQ